MKNIVIGGAWPYANGSLHIGHIASLLPGDVLARYFRAKGNRVFYVSGSDCHGTPITIRAKQENSTPEAISEYYHREFSDVFNKLGFSYDFYTKTSDPKHKEFVTQFHRKLYASDYVEERTVKQAFCPACQKILTDRMIVGICPVCGSAARGDQCDICGEVLDADTIIDAKCADCGTLLSYKETTQLFLQISKLRNEISEFLNAHPYWRKNAIAFTKRYIDEGLRDRAITRDLNWGIDVPRKGYEDKKSIFGQRMFWAICQQLLFFAKKGALVLKKYMEMKVTIIMYMEKIIFLFTQLSFPPFYLLMEKVYIFQMKLFPASI